MTIDKLTAEAQALLREAHDEDRRTLLTAREVAKALEVHYFTVLRWIHTGKIRAAQYPNGQFRIARAVLDDILQQREINS